MSKTFDTAEEATALMYELITQLNRVPYNPDLLRMYTNIKRMVTELSQLEVLARNSHARSKHREAYAQKRDEIQKAMTHLEHFILIATLMA